MRMRQVLVTCLVGAVGVAALPNAAVALPAKSGTVVVGMPAAPSYSTATLAPSLRQLRSEIDSIWPGRDRSSDGWLGDAYHQMSKSEHNPVGHPYGPVFGTPGSVHALDITASGVDTSVIVSALLSDYRVWYVIHNRTIWSRTYGFSPRPYHGNPHTSHIHVSLRADYQTGAVEVENDTTVWLDGVSSATSVGFDASQTRALQVALIARGFSIPAGATGTYGPQTRAAVAAFQRSQGWSGSSADGLAGAETLRRLGISGSGSGSSVVLVSAPNGSTGDSYVIGASGPHIVAMQEALIRRGMSIPSGPTGYFGSQTQAAVAAFQRAQGWSGSSADGIPGPRTLALLAVSGNSVATPPSNPGMSGVYAPGASGAHVTSLQSALLQRGFSIPSGATGWFGAETQAAVAAFQQSQGWSGSSADGLPGPVTLSRLGLA